MKIYNGLLGVLSIIFALYCILWAGEADMSVGWMVATILGLWGIGLVACFASQKTHGVMEKDAIKQGVIVLVLGIVAIVLAVLAFCMPELQDIFLKLVMAVFVLFLVVNGIVNIVNASKKKQKKQVDWVFGMVLGVVELIVAIAALFSGLFAAQVIKIIIGVMLGVFGVSLIVSIFQKQSAEKLEAKKA